MLTDIAPHNLKSKSRTDKAFDRDGMDVTVSPTGTVTFPYDFRLNGRRENLTIGRYGPSGISLAMAREMLIDATKAAAKGEFPHAGEAARKAPIDHHHRLDAPLRQRLDMAAPRPLHLKGSLGFGLHARHRALRTVAAARCQRPRLVNDKKIQPQRAEFQEESGFLN